MRRHIAISLGVSLLTLGAGDTGAPQDEETAPMLKQRILRTFPEAEPGQQGIAADGKHVYVQSTFVLTKLDMNGKLVAKTPKSGLHHGGIEYHDGKIYAAVSECCREGTDVHKAYVYDAATLEKVAEHDIAGPFSICAGGISYHDGCFYVAESYYDNDHDDYIVQFDAEFNFVRGYHVKFKSPYGIQGLDYAPSLNKFIVHSHGKEFYLIDTDFDSASIEPCRAEFELQDVAALDDRTFVCNDRPGKRIVFFELTGREARDEG